MFCKNCGKEYNEGSLFCIYCGAKIESDEASSESPARPAENVGLEDNSAPSAETAVSQPVQSIAAESAQPVPEPVRSSVSFGTAEPVLRPMERSSSGVSSYDFTVTEKPAPEKSEKYYTFGHLAICLAAVAVMAIVAGVFAGLYFSAIA